MKTLPVRSVLFVLDALVDWLEFQSRTAANGEIVIQVSDMKLALYLNSCLSAVKCTMFLCLWKVGRERIHGDVILCSLVAAESISETLWSCDSRKTLTRRFIQCVLAYIEHSIHIHKEYSMLSVWFRDFYGIHSSKQNSGAGLLTSK